MTHRLTGNQPEPVKQRIYGSVLVKPLDGAANQPQVLPNTKVYGARKLPTVRVNLKGGTEKELIINAADFDESIHERLE